ncbi:MAG: polysaccharide deacetylase family protein [Monoglobales bacterium]
MSYRYKFLRFPGGKGKAVTFSYDDGVKKDIRFSEILKKYNLKGTFNLNSLTLRGEHGITKEEVADYILSKGHEVAVHRYIHRGEGVIRPIEGIREVLDCRIELEKEFNRIIISTYRKKCMRRSVIRDSSICGDTAMSLTGITTGSL